MMTRAVALGAWRAARTIAALSHVRDGGAGNSGVAAIFAAICAQIVRRGVVAILLRWFDLRRRVQVNSDL
jgi:hypothetical protein